MKRKNLFKFVKYSMYLTIGATFLLSCNDDEDIEASAQTDFEQMARFQIDAEMVSEGVSSLLEEIYVSEDLSVAKKAEMSKTYMYPECVMITSEMKGNLKTLVLDFGDGCSSFSGDQLKGKVISVFSYDLTTASINVKHTYENFYFNGYKIEGLTNVDRIRLNDFGNPEAMIIRDLTITNEDGYAVEAKGNHKREWIEGYATRTFDDDAFLITGNWSIIHPDGSSQSGKINEPLRKEYTCKFVNKGTIEIQRKGKKLLLDFGDGECDDLATIEANGKLYEIKLRK
ncbi:hypothetical protein [Namhaeicola litoreus]|uniref:Lipoprotein n=1 Tax=Namhaeicola litoreus TaxID=1052145 RepID=A0ABW3Y0E8_9FLAO